MNIGIIGGGSIGLLVGSFLSLNHQVTIYVRREEQKQKINTNGLMINDANVSLIKTLLINEIEKEDCLIVCVKQPQLSSVLPSIQNIQNNIPIIFLQNGMGHTKCFEMFDNPLYVGVVEHGAIRKNDNHVIHTGKGLIRLAPYQGDENQFHHLVKELNLPTFPFKSASNWRDLLYEKLIVNAVINPLTTLFNVKNRMILDNPYICLLAKQLCKEAADTLHLNYTNEWQRVQKIAKATGNNISSMLADINNKQKTELEAITGYLLKESKQEMPFTSFIYNSIKALEIKNEVK